MDVAFGRLLVLMAEDVGNDLLVDVEVIGQAGGSCVTTNMKCEVLVIPANVTTSLAPKPLM